MNPSSVIPRLTSLIFLLLSLSLNSLWAQAGTIKGKVTNGTNAPFADINISLEGTQYGAATESDGRYQINKIPSGNYVLVASGVGFQTQKEEITVEAGEIYTVNFTLDPANEQLQEVLVEGEQTNKFANKESEYVAKIPLKNMENPQVYSTISEELIDDQLVVNVDDALRNAPGITKVWGATGRQGDGGAYFNSRGFLTQISLRNGITSAITNITDAANIERIEVIKGPSATLFGSQSNTNGSFAYGYGGLINRITKTPYDEFGGEVKVNISNYDFYRGSIDLNTPIDQDENLLFRINGAYQNTGSFQKNVTAENIFIAPLLTLAPNDRLSVQLDAELAYGHNDGFNTMLFFFLFPPNVLGYDNADQIENIDYTNSYQGKGITQSSTSANYFGEVNYKLSNQFRSQTNIAYSRSSSEGRNPYFMLVPDSVITHNPNDTGVNHLYQGDQSTAEGTYNYVFQINQNFNGKFNIGGLRNRAVLGLDFTQIDSDIRFYSADVINVVPLNTDYDYSQFNGEMIDNFYDNIPEEELFRYTVNSRTRNYSAYVADMISLTDELDVLASLRIDHYTNENLDTGNQFNQTSLSPKLGVIWQPVEDRLSLFANYQNAFTNLGFYDAYSVELDSIIVAEADAEQANQWEAGIKSNLLKDKLGLTLSYYHINIENSLRFDARGGGSFAQRQDATRLSEGVEFEVYALLVDGLDITGGLAYNHSEYTKADEDVEGRRPGTAGPPWSANWWLSYELPHGVFKNLKLGFGGNYAGDNKVINSISEGTFTLPAYTLLNASVNYDWKNLSLGFKVDNLTNEHYWIGWTTMNAQPLRNFAGSVSYNF